MRMGSLREKMLEEEHARELQRLSDSPERIDMAFTETVAIGERTITTTASAIVNADSDLDQMMQVLKRSVRSSQTPTA